MSKRDQLSMAILLFTCVIAWFGFFYLTPILSPQYVNFSIKPIASSETVILNGQHVIGDWESSPYGPKPFLGGFDSFSFQLKTVQTETFYPPPLLSIYLPLKNIASLSKYPTELPIKDFYELIQYNSVYYGSDTNYYNNKLVAADCKAVDILEGTITIDKFDQRFKGITFKGKLSLKAQMFPQPDSCEGESVTLEIKDLEFDIASELIYEWSNKGGDTYRI